MNPYVGILEIKALPVTEAQRALRQAVATMNEEKEIYEISVKNLCNKAHVARSTFYTYYNVVDDIVQEIENELLCEIMKINAKFATNDKMNEEALDFFKENLDFVMKNKKIFYLFLVKRPNYRFIQKWKRGIKYHFYHRVAGTKTEQDKELTLEMIAAQTIAAYTYWIQNPYEINISMVKKLILDTLRIYC